MDGKENWEEKSMRVSLQEKYSSMRAVEVGQYTDLGSGR